MGRAIVIGVILAVAAPARGDGMPPAAPGDDRPVKLSMVDAKKSKAKKKRKRKRSRRRRGRVQTPSFDVTTTPAWRYGQLGKAACEAELARRGVPFASEPTRGVLAGVRLTGPIRGVTFRSRLSAEQRRTSPWEVLDCRLALALDDFAAILVAHDVVDVKHYSMYRTAPTSWSAERIGSQHHGGLAIDAAVFTRRDGTKLDVLADWSGRIGAKTCGPAARPRRKTERSLALRAILCEVAAKRIFNVILTPNHNRAHRNHFHLDVSPGARWFVVD